MKYYKLVDNNKIIGAVCSNDFIYYSPIVDCFLRNSELSGEYITFENKLYRDTWMCPIQVRQPYINVKVLEITQEEYDTYMAAIHENEELPDEEEEEEIPVEEPEYPDAAEFIRESKISEMSAICRQTIEAGFDLQIRDAIRHFSLSTQDQLNLISLSAMAQTQSLIPYHADGEEVTFYTAEEINEIVKAAAEHKIYHTTYFNALKQYINALETIEEIAAIEYGTEIPDEYKTDVLKILNT